MWQRPKRVLGTAVAVAVMLLGAGCGDDDGDDGAAPTTAPPAATSPTSADAGSTATSAAAEEDFDPEGVVRIPYEMQASGGLKFDPVGVFIPHQPVLGLVYDSLLRPLPGGGKGPGLAREARIVDPRTIEVELFEGIRFSDGTPLDAEAARTGLLRNVEHASGPAFRAFEMSQVQDIVVTSPTSFRITLKSDIAGNWFELLATGDVAMVSPKAIADGVDLNTKPVGAGPFLLESFDPATKAVFVKNPDYFKADEVKAARIELIQMGDPVSQTNAIRSGAVDIVPTVATTQIPALSQIDDIEMTTEHSGNRWQQMFICQTRPPFDDVRVRQALNLAIDREAIGRRLYGDNGPPAIGVWLPGSPFHDPEIDAMYPHDPDRARQLLADAGVPNLSFTALTTGGDTQVFMEMVQQQLADVGVTMQIQQTVNPITEYYQELRQPAMGAPWSQLAITKLSRLYRPGQLTNACDYDNPELNQLFDAIAAHDQSNPDAEAVALAKQAQRIVAEEALALFGVFYPDTAAWKDYVGGVKMVIHGGNGYLVPEFRDLYIKRDS